MVKQKKKKSKPKVARTKSKEFDAWSDAKKIEKEILKKGTIK